MKTWHWVVVAVVAVVVLDWAFQRPDSKARELNSALESHASAEMKAYPYKFRVLRVDGETAVVTTPRNFDVPAFRAIGSMFPEINVKDANNPAFIAAEKKLASVQSEAQKIVAAQPGIKSVSWELDRQWLTAQGIEVPDKK
ncbi:MAG: hypothetical protein WBP72_10095 [Rhodocyclaceae bacterium]